MGKKLSAPELVQEAEPASVVYLRDPALHPDQLLAGLRSGQTHARAALFERHAARVERLLYRLLGPDGDIPDLVQEVFMAALAGVAAYRGDGAGLEPWLLRITVFTARGVIRRRRARAWLRFVAPEEVPEVSTEDLEPARRELLHHTYALLARLPTDERIAFTLRFVEGLRLEEIGVACGVARATVVRRLARARDRFSALAQRDRVVREWLVASPAADGGDHDD